MRNILKWLYKVLFVGIIRFIRRILKYIKTSFFYIFYNREELRQLAKRERQAYILTIIGIVSFGITVISFSAKTIKVKIPTLRHKEVTECIDNKQTFKVILLPFQNYCEGAGDLSKAFETSLYEKFGNDDAVEIQYLRTIEYGGTMRDTAEKYMDKYCGDLLLYGTYLPKICTGDDENKIDLRMLIKLKERKKKKDFKTDDFSISDIHYGRYIVTIEEIMNFIQGNSHFDNKNFEKAIHHFKKAYYIDRERRQYDSNFLIDRIAESYLYLNETDSAEKYSKLLLKKAVVDDVEYGYIKITTWDENGSKREINSGPALIRGTDSTHALIYLAESYFKEKKYHKAIEYIDIAIKYDTNYYDLFRLRGIYNLDSGVYQAAILDFNLWLKKVQGLSSQYIISTGPQIFRVQNFISVYRGMALANMSLNKYHEALKYCNQWYELAPNDSMVYIFRTDIYSKLRNYNQAISELLKANNLKKNKREYNAVLAYYYMATGEYLKADKLFKKAIKDYPNNALYYFHYAWLKEHRVRYDEAFILLDKVIELDSSNYYSKCLFSKSRILKAKGEYQQAIDTINLILEKEPMAGQVNYERAILYILNDEYQKSIPDFKGCYNHKNSFLFLSIIYDIQNNIKSSEYYFNKYCSLNMTENKIAHHKLDSLKTAYFN